MELLASLASACLGRSLAPRERGHVGGGIATAAGRAGVLPPCRWWSRHCSRPSRGRRALPAHRARDLLEDGRDVALELRRLVHGDLCGMFDGPTTPGLDLSAPLVVLDLSALYTSAALGVLMACATAWLQAALARTAGRGGFEGPRGAAVLPGGRRGVGDPVQPGRGPLAPVVVEALACLRRVQRGRTAPGVGPALGGGLRLRAGGTGQGAAGRLRDPRRLRPVARASWPRLELLSLSATEAESAAAAAPGHRLCGRWGSGSFLVQHRLSAIGSSAGRTPTRPWRPASACGPRCTALVPLALGGALFAGSRPGGSPHRAAAAVDSTTAAPAGPAGATCARPGRCDHPGHPGRLALGDGPWCRRAQPVSPPSRPSRSWWSDPTQSGKTTALAVPAILGWEGPVVAASVKSDLLRDTRGRAERTGPGVVHRSHRLHRVPAEYVVAAHRLRGVAPGRGGRRPICARRPRPTARPPTASSGTPRRPSCWPRSSSPRPATAAPWPTWCAGSTRRRSGEVADILEAVGVARGARRGPGVLVPRRAHAQLGLHHGRDVLAPFAHAAGAAAVAPFEPRRSARRSPHALPLRAGPRPASAARLLHAR